MEGVTPMEKKVLEQYMDACELIKETEKDIRRLKKKRQTIVQTNVSGSNPDFPYNPQHFKSRGQRSLMRRIVDCDTRKRSWKSARRTPSD